MKTQVALALFAALSVANISNANWDEKSENQLDMQIAKINASRKLAEYLGQQTGQEIESNDYTSESKLVSANSKDGRDALPATFDVTLFTREQDGKAGKELIQAEVNCVRGRTNQVSRFTRVTYIDCSVVRTF